MNYDPAIQLYSGSVTRYPSDPYHHRRLLSDPRLAGHGTE